MKRISDANIHHIVMTFLFGIEHQANGKEPVIRDDWEDPKDLGTYCFWKDVLKLRKPILSKMKDSKQSDLIELASVLDKIWKTPPLR